MLIIIFLFYSQGQHQKEVHPGPGQSARHPGLDVDLCRDERGETGGPGEISEQPSQHQLLQRTLRRGELRRLYAL